MTRTNTNRKRRYIDARQNCATEERFARAGGLQKAADIARYYHDLFDRHPAWKAACLDIETSCLATAVRIVRGEPEDPTTSV